jgi:hypothetical protein
VAITPKLDRDAAGLSKVLLMNVNQLRIYATFAAVVFAPSFDVARADPVSRYYLTAGDQGTNWVVQGNSIINSWPQFHTENQGEYAIAVAGFVRTLGNGYQGGHPGSEYTLAGVYTGRDFLYPVSGASFFDGTTDGSHNFSVDFDTGDVFQFDTNWANPVLLFSVSSAHLGITYDPTNNSLWISEYIGSDVENYTLAGELLSSFPTSVGAITSLALDPADNMLWMGSQATKGTFYQYSKAGLQFDTVTYHDLLSQNTLGGEFNFNVPEPCGILTCLFGCLIAIAYRRHILGTRTIPVDERER